MFAYTYVFPDWWELFVCLLVEPVASHLVKDLIHFLLLPRTLLLSFPPLSTLCFSFPVFLLSLLLFFSQQTIFSFTIHHIFTSYGWYFSISPNFYFIIINNNSPNYISDSHVRNLWAYFGPFNSKVVFNYSYWAMDQIMLFKFSYRLHNVLLPDSRNLLAVAEVLGVTDQCGPVTGVEGEVDCHCRRWLQRNGCWVCKSFILYIFPQSYSLIASMDQWRGFWDFEPLFYTRGHAIL